MIEKLEVGKTYILREEFAPYGYSKATDVEFTVEGTEEIQSVVMKDEVPTGTIVINKDGEFLTDINLIKGHWYDFVFDYFKKSLAGVTFEVYAAEDIVGSDGLNTVYYAKDSLVAEMFSTAAELVEFMDTNDMLFHLSDKEAEILLNYLSGHDFILGHKDGKLFRGDLDYAQDTIRWLEDTIDEAVDFVCQCNDDLIKTAQAELENPENFIDFVNKKSRLDSLWEDERVLDVMFDRTKYGKEIEELAKTLVENFLTDMRAKGGVGEAVKKLTEAIGSTTDMLQEKNVELKPSAGRAR